MDEQLAAQLKRRDRFLQRQWLALSPEERVRRMAAMHEASWNLLRSNPTGYTHFLRRNFRARAIDTNAIKPDGR
jgi:hypothetical protein